MLVTLITASGPNLAFMVLAVESTVLFWIGVAIALLNLFMDLAGETMKLPILPGIGIVIGIVFFGPWWTGAAIGLLGYTAVEAAGMVIAPFVRPGK